MITSLIPTSRLTSLVGLLRMPPYCKGQLLASPSTLIKTVAAFLSAPRHVADSSTKMEIIADVLVAVQATTITLCGLLMASAVVRVVTGARELVASTLWVLLARTASISYSMRWDTPSVLTTSMVSVQQSIKSVSSPSLDYAFLTANRLDTNRHLQLHHARRFFFRHHGL
jgi:ABC-type iron transport system FetAB permease component